MAHTTRTLLRAAAPALVAPALLSLALLPASATVTPGVGAGTLGLSGDGADDFVHLECVDGQARHGGVDLIACSDLETLSVSGGGGKDTLALHDVTPADFPNLVSVVLEGGPGDDTILGSALDDHVSADSGDEVQGNGGHDLIEGAGQASGGPGDDVLHEVSGSADGGPGDDLVHQPGSGPIIGGPGEDTVTLDYSLVAGPRDYAFELDDDGITVRSGGSNLTVSSASVERYEMRLSARGVQEVDARRYTGAVVLHGRAGRDLLTGGRGEDHLVGGSGPDRLVGGRGFDYLVGGAGGDTILARDGRPDRVLCGAGKDRVTADRVDALVGCEQVRRR